MSDRDGPGGPAHAFRKAVSGAVQMEVLDVPLGSPPRNTRVDDFSRDGRYAIEADSSIGSTGIGKGGAEVWVQPSFGDRKPFPYLKAVFNEHPRQAVA